MELHQLSEIPIQFIYNQPSLQAIHALQKADDIWEIKPTSNIIVDNRYFKEGYEGTLPRVYARAAVCQRLQAIVNFLAPHYGLFIFDAFRTRATQAQLFHNFQQEIKIKYPQMSQKDLETETRKYVSHPNEPSRFAVPPHNSGGAIDLALFDLSNKILVDFGSPLDLTESISATDFFEQPYQPGLGISEERWSKITRNRRIIFNTMKHFGFTNYHTEWWHYDLGDCMWAIELHTDWVFASMEEDVYKLCPPGKVSHNVAS